MERASRLRLKARLTKDEGSGRLNAIESKSLHWGAPGHRGTSPRELCSWPPTTLPFVTGQAFNIDGMLAQGRGSPSSRASRSSGPRKSPFDSRERQRGPRG
jgi:hypothetical protein